MTENKQDMELKKCPLCRKPALSSGGDHKNSIVGCAHCHLWLPRSTGTMRFRIELWNTRSEPEEVSQEGKKFGGGPPFVCDHCKGCTEAFEQAQKRIKELEKEGKAQSRKILNFGGDALGLQRELAELKEGNE